MLLTRAARQLTLRIALIAILLGALAPTISHALRSGGSAAWVEVCTVLGAKWVTNEASHPGESTPATAHLSEDCPHCALQAHSPALPSAPQIGLISSSPQFAVPLLFLLASHPLHAWTSAQPRAPPRIS
jgi:hypothetical protein